MANLSKIKRDKMLEYLEKLKEINTDDENIRAITEIENALNEKKYGLVWEEHSEKVDEMLEHNIPIFIEDETRKITANENEAYNFLLEGDNLHSLKLLEKTHKGKIDVIYIDPPYNTGKEFVYNDDLIANSDSYRHSKWLSFMCSRLVIARELLDAKGVIFLSIDDNEFSQLKMLCDEIFGENNNVANFCVIRAEGGGMAKQVIKGHDYCLVYAKDIFSFSPLAKEKDIRGKIVEKDKIKYWIQEDWLRKEFGKYGNCHYEEVLQYKGEKVKKEIDEGLKNGEYVLIPKSNGMNIIGKLRRLDQDSSKFYSILKHLNKNGVNELKELNIEFDYPKPSSLIKELVSGATFFSDRKEATVLDFFAGSGTTGHAVMQLNKEDGGNRRYILCTNNENNICEKVTYQRLKNIQGELSHNLKYYKTDFIPKFSDDEESISEKMMEHIRELIELEYAIELDGKKYIVLNDEDELDVGISKIENYGKLFVRSGIFLSRSNQRILEEKSVSVIEIPEYYFREELKEVGEL
ncbi:site-specific DNA-methyltransferase [Fusobacterium necrophorum]|uniref:Site-specific DNA-methyltransferase n=1 Tax=Fusobacterium necrophorum TaxID=859 RepID=A0A4Q2L596_9FUSO|nr:site-specific DNA-methyltransferase [Fusobacterium necrophorum]RXZ71532.1 site-specific DNA-methyltransferase [Fusobacterium necrophorum]